MNISPISFGKKIHKYEENVLHRSTKKSEKFLVRLYNNFSCGNLLHITFFQKVLLIPFFPKSVTYNIFPKSAIYNIFPKSVTYNIFQKVLYITF